MKFVTRNEVDKGLVLDSIILSPGDDGIDTIVVPSVIDGEKVSIVDLTSFNLDHPVHLVFEEGITSVRGFCLNKYVTEVTFPRSLEIIARSAFSICLNLKKINFAKNGHLTFICDEAFKDTNLESVEIPKSVKEIGSNAFSSSGIESLTFEKGGSNLCRINHAAFADNADLKYAELPKTLPGIDITLERAIFSGCASLETFCFLGNNVSVISSQCFAKCLDLSTIKNIPSKLKEIHKEAFIYCRKLTNIDLRHTILNRIESYAFSCTNLKTVSFPDTLVTICNSAFEDTLLEEITLPKSLEFISKNAFKNCTLTRINNIEKLTDVTLGDECFADNRFESLSLPPLNDVGLLVFSDNTLLEFVEFSNGSAAVHYSMFARCERLKEVVLPSTIKEIGAGAFLSCRNLKSINMENIKLIGTRAFAYSSLKKFHNHNANLVVKENAFSDSGVVDISVSPYAQISDSAFPWTAWRKICESRVF